MLHQHYKSKVCLVCDFDTHEQWCTRLYSITSIFTNYYQCLCRVSCLLCCIDTTNLRHVWCLTLTRISVRQRHIVILDHSNFHKLLLTSTCECYCLVGYVALTITHTPNTTRTQHGKNDNNWMKSHVSVSYHVDVGHGHMLETRHAFYQKWRCVCRRVNASQCILQVLLQFNYYETLEFYNNISYNWN